MAAYASAGGLLPWGRWSSAALVVSNCGTGELRPHPGLSRLLPRPPDSCRVLPRKITLKGGAKRHRASDASVASALDCDLCVARGCPAREDSWTARVGAAPRRYGGHRTRPVTGATGRGSSARRRASARRARRKLPHRQRCVPRSGPGRLRRATFGVHLSLRLAAPAFRASRPGCQARRAEGAPLMIVKKILTTTAS